MKQPKKLMRNGPRGKVITRAAQEAAALRAADARKRMQQGMRPVRINDLTINVIANPYRNGPFSIKTIKCPRRRNTEMVEVEKRALVDCAGVPIKFGPRKWLDKQLAKYELGYAKYIMTQGTAAEGM